MTSRVVMGLWAVLVVASATPAGAQPSTVSYAVVVGSNQGGAGQQPLSFAERDAQRFAELLTELGRMPTEHVELLLAPSGDDVRERLASLHARLRAHAQAGEPTQLVFFYSGHARADAANLGDDMLPLGELRAALTSLPTTLTVVILDACQSGAFSGVKGASPAADFSFNSVERLSTEGLAVLASSTGTELSQESSELGASYFTHHLMVALRGAGDRDADGRVSLDEAYRYAYRRTLADTSRTRVGSQHVTLEMDVKGKGQVPLSFPAEASSRLHLPRALRGTVLVQRADKGAVMAEVVKAPSAPLSLALPPGLYDTVVRDGERVYECQNQLDAGDGSRLDLDGCDELTLEEWRAKGAPPPAPHEKWFFEVGWGGKREKETSYTRRLEVFGFEETDVAGQNGVVEARTGLMLSRYLGVTLGYEALERRVFRRAFDGPSGESNRDEVSWAAHRAAAGVRLRWPIHERWLSLYANTSVGVALAAVRFEQRNDGRDDSLELGPSVDAVLGVHSNVARWFGVFVEGGYGWAPVPENLIGDRHNAAGGRFLVGARIRTEGTW